MTTEVVTGGTPGRRKRPENGKSRLVARMATTGLAGVLLFMVGFAIWSARRTNDAAHEATDSTFLSDAYGRARSAVASEDFWATEYLLKLGPETRHVDVATIRAKHRTAATSLIAALREVRRSGEGGDRRLADAVLARHDLYRAATGRLFGAIDKRQPKRALKLERGEIDPLFAQIEERVEVASSVHRVAALDELASMRRAHRVVYLATMISFLAGLVLLATFAVVLRVLSRRAEQAAQIELERLERAALIDSLTGLRNHRAFHEDVTQELALADRSGLPLSVAMLDVEGLKQVNDSLGHQKGDEQLQVLASALQHTMRESEAAYRIGGDEFAVILGEGAWGAFQFVQRLQAELDSRPLQPRLAVAAGVAEGARRIRRDELLRQADLALVESKRSRRGMVIYGPELGSGDSPEQGLDLTEHHKKTLATALARAVDAKDTYTRSHCETVAETCVLIARELGCSLEQTRRLRLAGLLHDVGKIGIADAVLQKPGPLTEEEFALMKRHPVLGQSIVSAAGLEEEARWILHHHERPDGSGYPDGLTGEEVPLESRIILVADAFEAITADRPYRKGRPVEDAVAELYAHTGTQFDPRCVRALVTALGLPQESRHPKDVCAA